MILEKNRVDRQGDEAEFENDDVVGEPCPESNEMGKAGEKSLKVDLGLYVVSAPLSLKMGMI